MLEKWIAAILTIWSCASTPALCPPVPEALTDLFKPGYIILIGEIHGTQEVPEYVANAVCHARQSDLGLKVGLELPADDQSGVATWMRSSGGTTVAEQGRQSGASLIARCGYIVLQNCCNPAD